LARLSGTIAELAPFSPLSSCTLVDLTAIEAEAASRATACPDLFLIHSPDHTVRERLIAAIAHLSVSESGRSLVMSPNPIAADRIAERVAKFRESGVVRALADDENPARPSPIVARLTSGAIENCRCEWLKREAAAVVAVTDARLTALEKLTDLVAKRAQLGSKATHLTTKRDNVEAAARSEVDTPFATKLLSLKATHDETATRLATELDTLTRDRTGKEAALVAVRQQHAEATAEAAKKPGLLSRLFGPAKTGPTPSELEKQIAALEADIAALVASAESVRAKITDATTRAAVEPEQAIQDEVSARRAAIDSEIANLAAEQEQLCAEIEPLQTSLALATLDGLADARYTATLALVEAKECAAVATQNASAAARRSLAEIPVVVGTPGSLHADAVFERHPANDGTPAFTLLVLDQAEQLGEQEFVQLAKLATRWVLIGDALPAEDPKPHHNGSSGRHGHGRNGRPVEPSFAARLARHLDRETWVTEGSRLVCRLVHASPEQRRGMTREPLLDRPEIELRFLMDSNDEPVLAEVAFPGSAGIANAKSFLFHQLGEVLLRPLGTLTWHHTTEAITAGWPEVERGSGEVAWVDLELGVREKVVGVGATAFTAAVCFDPAAGWDVDRAAEWVSERVRRECSSRYTAVPRTGRV
jgi:hypothetical protein